MVKKELSEEQRGSIVKMYLENKSYYAISKTHGISDNLTKRILAEEMVLKIDVSDDIMDNIVNDYTNCLYWEQPSLKELGIKYSLPAAKIPLILRLRGVDVKARGCKSGTIHSGSFKKKYTMNEDVFNVIDSEEKAYWLGMMASDGYVLSGNYIGLMLKEDDEYLIEKFQKFLETDVPIRKCGRSGNMREIRIHSSKLHHTLYKKGIVENKAKAIDYETVAANVPENMINHFIRGIYDGDGCISICNNIPYVMLYGTLPSLVFVEKYWKTDNQIRKDERTSTSYILRCGGNDKCSRVLKFIYQNATLFMERKYERAKLYKLL